MRAFVIALLGGGFGAHAAEGGFLRPRGEKAGAALGVFLRGRARPAHRPRPRAASPSRARIWKKKSGRPFPCFGPLPAACLRMCVEQLRAQGDLGLDDAAATALATGLLQAFLRAVGAAAGARVAFGVRPDFQKRRLRGELAGIASLRVGHIIAAALMGVWEDWQAQTWISIPLKVLWPPPWRASAIWWTSTPSSARPSPLPTAPPSSPSPAWPSASWPAAGEYKCAKQAAEAPSFAGGTGAGVSVQPVGFIVVSGGQVRLLPAQAYAPVDRIIEMVPQLLSQIKKAPCKAAPAKRRSRPRARAEGAVASARIASNRRAPRVLKFLSARIVCPVRRGGSAAPGGGEAMQFWAKRSCGRRRTSGR